MKRVNFNDVKTQREAILWHLQNYGNITSWEAIKEYGATRLSSIIFNLRSEGLDIVSEDLQVQTRFGRNVNVAKYILITKVNQQTALF